MRLMLETSKATFTVSKAAEPKMDQTQGRQRVHRQSGSPEWVVEMFALDPSGGDVIRVTVAGEQPRVTQGQPVRVDGLEAIAWSNNGRSGVAYRAESITPVSQQPKAV